MYDIPFTLPAIVSFHGRFVKTFYSYYHIITSVLMLLAQPLLLDAQNILSGLK
jgi:hypothetical protein